MMLSIVKTPTSTIVTVATQTKRTIKALMLMMIRRSTVISICWIQMSRRRSSVMHPILSTASTQAINTRSSLAEKHWISSWRTRDKMRYQLRLLDLRSHFHFFQVAWRDHNKRRQGARITTKTKLGIINIIGVGWTYVVHDCSFRALSAAIWHIACNNQQTIQTL